MDIVWILEAQPRPHYGIITETATRNGAAMRPAQFSADTLITLLRKQTIASLPEVIAALGARASRRTAFRKLKDLAARTSYSHRGGYYTLDELVDFDERGLWSFAGVRFSRIGTLIATAESFVSHAEAGHFGEELDNLLHVGTQDALRKLVRDGRLTRHQLTGQFLYCAVDRPQQAQQPRARSLLLATPGLVRPLPDADLMPEERRAAVVLYSSSRTTSRSTGCGAPVADAGGRKKTPEVIARLEALMAHETAGDPVRGLKWTRRTTAKIAAQLRTLGIDVCARTVARLLTAMGFSLRVNHKKLAGASHPNRNDQFEHITALRERCAAENTPVISVDTKKKELVGAFKNAGAKWDRSTELVKDHDFGSEAKGRAVPYGIYDECGSSSLAAQSVSPAAARQEAIGSVKAW